MSRHEETLAFQLRHATDLSFEREYRFHPTRRWKSDFAIFRDENWSAGPVPELPILLVEVEGAIRGKPGRHQRIDGMTNDCEKYAEALALGMPTLRVMPSQVHSGEALRWIERICGGKG